MILAGSVWHMNTNIYTMNADMSRDASSKTSSKTIRVGILTISDRCWRREVEDVSGSVLKQAIEGSRSSIDWVVAETDIVPDDRRKISSSLVRWCSPSFKLDLILTTGGTGLSERDVTPEATEAILDKQTPGITSALMVESLKITPMAMLSRLISGVRERTLIINFPGSPKACTQCLDIVKPVIKHAIDLLRGSDEANDLHNTMIKMKSKVDVSKVARRNRKSTFDMITVEEAQRRMISHEYKLDTVNKKIRDAVGFVAAEDIYAKEPFPPFRASIKDGYAVITEDGVGARTVISSSLAGFILSNDASLKLGECMRITTGAPLPNGSDAVVQVEDTLLVSESDHGQVENVVNILELPKKGQDIREIGSDIKEGELLVSRGTILTPGALGVLATAGYVEVPVYKKPKVAVLSTGNELQAPGEALKPGKVRDCNKTALLTLLDERGFPAYDSGIAVDDPNILLNVIHDILEKVDVLITTGGVSMGERDLLADVLVEDFKAEVIFGRLKMKPGKPTKFFEIPTHHGPKYVFALPGNPVSAFVTSHLLVFPTLRAMSGWPEPLPMLFRVKIPVDLKLDERYEYARAFLTWNKGEDIPSAVLTGNQISSRLMSMTEAECLLHLPAATLSMKVLPAGSIVDAELINQNLTRITDISV